MKSDKLLYLDTLSSRKPFFRRWPYIFSFAQGIAAKWHNINSSDWACEMKKIKNKIKSGYHPKIQASFHFIIRHSIHERLIFNDVTHAFLPRRLMFRSVKCWRPEALATTTVSRRHHSPLRAICGWDMMMWTVACARYGILCYFR
jgi:hypothetical protein